MNISKPIARQRSIALPAAWTQPLALALLFGAALALRLWGLGWGLPYVEHPDEPALLRITARMVNNDDPNPHFFLYPSLYFYMLAAVARLHLWWGVQSGLYDAAQRLPDKTDLYTTMPGLYIWCRAITALLGAATVPALYALGRAMFGWRAGLLGALALLLSGFHMAHSQYITTDAATGLWVTLAVYGAWQVATRGSPRGYLLAGAMIGLAAGTKYNAAIVALALCLAHLLYWRRGALGRAFGWLCLGGLVAALAFLLTTPYALLSWREFSGGLSSLSSNYSDGAPASSPLGNVPNVLRMYGAFLWDEGLLAPGCLLALAGLPLLARRAPRALALMLAVAGAELALLSAYKVQFTRNILPVFPLLLLMAAAAAVVLAERAGRAPASPSAVAHTPGALGGEKHYVLAALALLLLAPLADRAAWLLVYNSRPHTLVAAAAQLRSLPQGMRIAVEMNPIQWADTPNVFPVKRLTEHDLGWYRANGFRYLFANDERRSHRAAAQSTYAELEANAQTLLRYPERSQGVQPGPGGRLLDLGEHVEQMRFAPRAATFGDQIRLLGYELAQGALRAQPSPLDGARQTSVDSGQGLQINLYWRALGPIDRDYMLFVHVLDAGGGRVAQRDLPLRYGNYPSSHWRAGELVIDRADLQLPALPPGVYRLSVGLYDPGDGTRLPVTSGAPASNSDLTLASVTIEE